MERIERSAARALEPSRMTKHLAEPWKSFLEEIDASLTESLSFHCIGGFVVTNAYGFARSTNDLDVLEFRPNPHRSKLLDLARKGSALHDKYGVYLDYVTMIRWWPENYETRLLEMYPGELKNITLCAPDPHDLMLMKLDRNNERDRDDLKYLAVTDQIDGETLLQRYREEMRPSVPIPERTTDIDIRLWVDIIGEVKERRDLLRQNNVIDIR